MPEENKENGTGDALSLARDTIRQQLRRNAVALISLIVAVTALAYNTWRNETTEEQRNIRHAAFRVFESLGEMQQVVDARFYFHESFSQSEPTSAELHLSGYGNVIMTRDLMSLMPPPGPGAGQSLYGAWLKHFDALDDFTAEGKHTQRAEEAEAALRGALEEARNAVLKVIGNLE